MYPRRPGDKTQKIIGYARFSGVKFFPDFWDILTDIPAGGDIDIEGIISRNKDIVEVIKRIGRDAFGKYFIYNDFDCSLEELGKRCGVPAVDIEKIIDFTNTFFAQARFFPGPAQISGVRYRRVASIRKERGKYYLECRELSFVRGPYRIDYDKWARLKEGGAFSPSDLRKIGGLISRLKVINLRKTTLFRVITQLIERQKYFLDTGRMDKLVPLNQKEISRIIGVHPSVVCRLLRARSVESPWREEIPLKTFFPTIKKARFYLFADFIAQNDSFAGDEQIRDEFARKAGIHLSRRTINKYRREL